MSAEVIAIGTELVSGQRLDTNSQWLSQRLGELGIAVHYHTALPDDLDAIVQALRVAVDRTDLIVIGGGLGPTQDDLTRDALAAVAGVPLIQDLVSLEALEAFFARRNRPMPDRNRVQSLIPQGAEPLANRVGTAPGLWMELGQALVICLPGVPSELKTMYDEQVLPRLRERGRTTGRVLVHRVVNLFGKGESEIEADALDLTARGRRPEVGIYAHDGTITFRVSCDGATEDEAIREIEPTLALIRQRFANLIVGEAEGVDVPEAAADALLQTGRTLAVAESCTGGLIASRLTAIPGVSVCFKGGVVAYANEVKENMLGVARTLLESHGAVSAQVAEAMAAGVRERIGADLGLSVTGIAGPEGGTTEKPVGLVFIGLATSSGVHTRKLEMGPEQPRSVIQSRSAKHALNWVRVHLTRR